MTNTNNHHHTGPRKGAGGNMTDRNQNETFASIDADTFFSLKAADSVIIPDGFEAAYHKEMTRIENEMTRLELT